MKRSLFAIFLLTLLVPPFALALPSYEIINLNALMMHSGDRGVAWDINDAGHVVGEWGYYNSFFYDGSTVETIYGWDSWASGINNYDQVVGYVHDFYTNDLSSPFYRTGPTNYLYEDGNFTNLGSLTSHTIDINDSGEIIEHTDYTGPANLIDLIMPDSGWLSLTGTAENSYGQIVGYGTFDYVSDGWSGTLQQAFVMTPVPEPSTLLLLGVGMVSLILVPRYFMWVNRTSVCLQ